MNFTVIAAFFTGELHRNPADLRAHQHTENPVTKERDTSGVISPRGTTVDFRLSAGALVDSSSPPKLALRAEPEVLWPPNGRLERVRVKVDVSAEGDPHPKVVLKSVTCEDGCSPTKDIAGADLGTDDRDVLLRAARNDSGRDRTYVLTYEATDNVGNVAQKDVSVVVPRDRGRGQHDCDHGTGGRD